MFTHELARSINCNKERRFNIAVSEVPFQLFLISTTATRSRVVSRSQTAIFSFTLGREKSPNIKGKKWSGYARLVAERLGFSALK